jgi:formylglycine-generating enzyme required for sulfatase activity
VRSVFKITLLLWIVAGVPLSWADRCEPSIAALASGSEHEPVSREALLREMAQLYSEALQNTTLMSVFEMRVQEMAVREKQSELDLYKEIEGLAPSPRIQKEIQEERAARKREEQLRLYSDLEPYLARIRDEDRKTIEEQIILPGLVKPLSTGEVEFRFTREHEFLVGDEGTYGENKGATKMVSFAPGDDFAIGQVPVTQFMYFLAGLSEGIYNPTPSRFARGSGSVTLKLRDRTYRLKPNHPVENVSYDHAVAHAGRVSVIVGGRYGLPTENQWEFANRAGNSGSYHFGNDETLLPAFAWFFKNSGLETKAVGELRANGFRLFDTHGNVDEWTSTSHSRHGDLIIRGGSSNTHAQDTRSSYRFGERPHYQSEFLGFRLERKISDNMRPAHTFTFGEFGTDARPGSVIEGGPR